HRRPGRLRPPAQRGHEQRRLGRRLTRSVSPPAPTRHGVRRDGITTRLPEGRLPCAPTGSSLRPRSPASLKLLLLPVVQGTIASDTFNRSKSMRHWIGAGALVIAVMGTTLPSAAQDQPAAAEQAQPAADVPVRAVVLFSSGVGYFEHFGPVQVNASTELRFKTEQINDILKSLVLEDLDGGRVGTITYPSQDPIDKTLRSFQIDITGNPPLAGLLNQLRGARVTLDSVEAELSGTVLGVESRRKPAGDDQTIEVPVLNLIAGGVIRSVELPEVRSLRLDDPQLQEELTKALEALAQARDQDKKPVVINFAGDGRRRVRIGYVVETPVWKTSYRLILGDREQPSKLQGWAIVENQTDSDWNDVQLSLVSGRPISFVQDLYQPLYIERPVVEPELYASLRPQRYKAGVGADVENQPEQSRLRDAR